MEAIDCQKLGHLHFSLGQYELGQETLKAYLDISSQNNADHEHSMEAMESIGLLGCCYSSLGQGKKAVKTHKKHLLLAKKYDTHQYPSLTNLANAHCVLKQHELAAKFMRQAIVLVGEVRNLQDTCTYIYSLSVKIYNSDAHIAMRMFPRG